MRFLQGMLLTVDILGLHVTFLGESYQRGGGVSRKITGTQIGPSLSRLTMASSSKVDPWEAENFPEALLQRSYFVISLGCPSCPKSQRRVMGQVRMEPLFLSLPDCCQPGWENLTRLDPQIGCLG